MLLLLNGIYYDFSSCADWWQALSQHRAVESYNFCAFYKLAAVYSFAIGIN
ncbi:hypothetical protein D3C76_1293190 [compost metagenome]